MFQERITQSPVLRRAILAMKLLGAFGADVAMHEARAQEPTAVVSHEAVRRKTVEDIKQEKIQKMAERQQLVNRTFTGIKVELVLTEDPYFEEYSVKVNGVMVGRVEQEAKLFAKRVDFYRFASDVEFLKSLQKVVDASEVPYTLSAEARQEQETRWMQLIEQAKAEMPIEIDSKSEMLINQWGGRLIGWVIIDGKPGYQIAPTAEQIEVPFFVDTNTLSLTIKAMGDNTILIISNNKDGSVQNIFVVDGKVQE